MVPRLVAFDRVSRSSDQRRGPPAPAANSSVRQARSKRTANITAVGASGPTVTAPWLGIRIAFASLCDSVGGWHPLPGYHRRRSGRTTRRLRADVHMRTSGLKPRGSLAFWCPDRYRPLTTVMDRPGRRCHRLPTPNAYCVRRVVRGQLSTPGFAGTVTLKAANFRGCQQQSLDGITCKSEPSGHVHRRHCQPVSAPSGRTSIVGTRTSFRRRIVNRHVAPSARRSRAPWRRFAHACSRRRKSPGGPSTPMPRVAKPDE
jgi:hypothetical protein